jgi:hypothetical protein
MVEQCSPLLDRSEPIKQGEKEASIYKGGTGKGSFPADDIGRSPSGYATKCNYK